MKRRWTAFTLLAADASASLLRRPWHAVGMMSGILLGVASATTAVVIADTQQAQVDLRFDLQRSDHVVVRAGGVPPAGFPLGQVRLVAALSPVAAVGEFSTWSERMPVSRTISSVTAPALVVVADAGGMKATGTRVVEGAGLGAAYRPASGTAVAWVGADLAKEIGIGPAGNDLGVDSAVVVAGRTFGVAGIVRNQDGFGYVDRSVLLSRAAATSQLGGAGLNIRLVAHVRPGSARGVAAYAVRTVDPGATMGLEDVTPPDGEKLLRNVGGDLRRIGVALSVFVGLVGMIAIANTLMMSVQHRRRELGLRSAMGWSRGRIGRLVLTESAVAGLVSSILGSAAGLLAAAVWCSMQRWTLIVSPWLPVAVTIGGVAASLVGGLLPAWRAASISPLTAMRS